MIRWTWNPDEDRRNRQKHQGLGLAAGAFVFADPFAVSLPDPHPDGDRWRTVGLAAGTAVLFVVHVAPVEQPDGQEVGRIISVRKATPRERKAYEQGIF